MATTKPTQLDVNETLNKSEAFFVKNKKIILGAIIALIVLVGGFYAYNNYVAKPNADKASTTLALGQNYFAAGDYETALNGDKNGFIGFLQIATKYSSTKAGNLANLYAGLCYAEKGETENAIKYLEKYDSKDDAMVSPAAMGALGNCYAKAGKTDKAIETLQKAAKMADNNTLSGIFLQQAGILLESQNKPAEAKKLYEEIKTKYTKSAEAQEIDKYLERVK